MPQTEQNMGAAVEVLLAWFAQNARPLPWRCEPTPYRVWVSEVMLQQTRIEAVIPYYERFMQALPTVASLAAVSDDRLLKLWEGLGYYSRARNLKKAAICLMEQYGGELPADFEALRALPGFGDYTAGAVASLAFGIAVPAVDGNVLRVTARLLNDNADILSTAVRRRMTDTVRGWLPPHAAGAFNAALMELGERICLPHTQPLCAQCPLHAVCAATAQGTAASLPYRAPKKARRVEQRVVFLVISNEPQPRVLLHRRPSSGLLAGMWELPNVEGRPTDAAAVSLAAALGADTMGTTVGEGRHLFSHVEWKMTGVRLTVAPVVPSDEYVWVTLTQLHEIYALPSAFRAFSRLLPVLLQEETI